MNMFLLSTKLCRRKGQRSGFLRTLGIISLVLAWLRFLRSLNLWRMLLERLTPKQELGYELTQQMEKEAPIRISSDMTMHL